MMVSFCVVLSSFDLFHLSLQLRLGCLFQFCLSFFDLGSVMSLCPIIQLSSACRGTQVSCIYSWIWEFCELSYSVHTRLPPVHFPDDPEFLLFCLSPSPVHLIREGWISFVFYSMPLFSLMYMSKFCCGCCFICLCGLVDCIPIFVFMSMSLLFMELYNVLLISILGKFTLFIRMFVQF